VSLIIKEIDYQNSKDISKLESALKNWFSNPKDLNFADPDSKYPFDMKKWINVNYKINKIRTVALYKDEWIIGFAGIKFLDDSDKAHIAQFYLDKESEGMGHKESLIKEIEQMAIKENVNKLIITAMKKDELAQNLYKRLNFKETKKTGNKLNFEKEIA
jgi:ribosomal protein S18 acetylase RimI-like enzyme|tara:strand:- start:215 stop:691 length:477 start_codon:yes stop_codon:yes gene_type:complete